MLKTGDIIEAPTEYQGVRFRLLEYDKWDGWLAEVVKTVSKYIAGTKVRLRSLSIRLLPKPKYLSPFSGKWI